MFVFVDVGLFDCVKLFEIFIGVGYQISLLVLWWIFRCRPRVESIVMSLSSCIVCFLFFNVYMNCLEMFVRFVRLV